MGKAACELPGGYYEHLKKFNQADSGKAGMGDKIVRNDFGHALARHRRGEPQGSGEQ